MTFSVRFGTCTDVWAEVEGERRDADAITELDAFLDDPFMASPDEAELAALAHTGVVLSGGDLGAVADTAQEFPVIMHDVLDTRAGGPTVSAHFSPPSFVESDSSSNHGMVGTSSGESESDESMITPVVAARGGKRKRVLRQSPPMTTLAPITQPSRGLSLAEKRACLEQMLADPHLDDSLFISRMRTQFPNPNVSTVRLFRKHVMARTRIAPWLHELLVANADTPEQNYPRLVARANAMAKLLGAPENSRMISTVREWLQFCVRPLKAHRGAIGDIVHPSITRKKTEWMQLSAAPLKAFLVNELESLNLTERATATKAPAVSRSQHLIRRSSTVPGALSMDIKRSILALMADHSDDRPLDFIYRVKMLHPGADSKRVYKFHHYLTLASQVPQFVHEFLLTSKAVRWDRRMAPDIQRLFLDNGATPCKAPAAIVNRWTKYCIVPLLALPAPASRPPCALELRRMDKRVMRLSLQQRRALYTDMLAEATERHVIVSNVH